MYGGIDHRPRISIKSAGFCVSVLITSCNTQSVSLDENTILQSVIEISVGLYSLYKAKTEKEKLKLHILILYNNIYNIKNTSKHLIHKDPFCV
jgi:hypothetical protein